MECGACNSANDIVDDIGLYIGSSKIRIAVCLCRTCRRKVIQNEFHNPDVATITLTCREVAMEGK